MVRKLRKDERVCKICGAIFRVKKNQKNIKYCSKTCKKTGHSLRVAHRASLGTPNTLSLTPKNIRREAKRIRENKDDYYVFTSSKSKREVILENMVYNQEQTLIYIVEEARK